MSNHAWCRDIHRDKAVRAAEDNRQGPLPTLEECIERQKHAAMKAGVVNGFFIAEGAVAMIPKSVSATSAPEQENKGDGMATNGLRTDRVTLEITQRADRFQELAAWDWPRVLDGLDRVRGESVRVVEEEDAFAPAPAIAGGTVLVSAQHMGTLAEFLRHTTRLTQESGVARRERDAAIREREEFRKALNVENDHALRITAERDALKARVAHLEDANRVMKDAADHSCDEWKKAADRVAELEGQLESVACRAATANSSAETVSAEPVAWGVVARGIVLATSTSRSDAVDMQSEHAIDTVVVPLYTAPPPARGWLTPDEIAVCVGLRDYCRGTWETWGRKDTLWLDRATTLDALLARSTPPEVELPVCESTRLSTHMIGFLDAIGRVKQALADAGVKVKEAVK